MMREDRGKLLIYKGFFHTNMAHELYFMREAIGSIKNEFFGPKWCLDNYSAQRIVESAELIYQAQTEPNLVRESPSL